MGDFPVTTINMEPMTIVGRVGVAALDLRAIREAVRQEISDPFVETVNEKVTRPATAAPTAGPHRYTLVVPNKGELSTLNLGQADPGANRINDTGLTGHSKTHVHFAKFDDPSTIISLGGGTTHGWPGFKDVLGSMQGYTMQTDGAAYQDALGQFYVVSREGEVIVRAAKERVRIQADTTNVEIAAHQSVNVGAQKNVYLVADTGATLNDAGYTQAFDTTWTELLGSKTQKLAMGLLDVAGTAQGLFSAFKTQNEIGDNFKSGWINDPNSTAKFWVDIAKTISTVGRYIHGLSAPGQVKISGENYAGMTGGIAASMFGNLSASVTSMLSASVLGGTASLKGIAWASVWAGMGVSMKTLWGKADVKSEYGKASLSAKEDVKIASKAASGSFTAKTKIQLNATAGPAALHGTESVLAIGGDGPGYGLGASKDGIMLGKFSSPKEFASPGPVKNESFWMLDASLGATFKSGKIQLDDSKFMAKAKKVDISAESGTVTMEGNKILIG